MCSYLAFLNYTTMAKINNKGMVSGSAGSVVYRNYRGMNIIQGKPRHFQQSSESIKASTEFGLSSSAAAIIRSAFEPAYLHRDGEAAARSTQLVHRSIRNSLTAVMGQRDLHDGDLRFLEGMDFNVRSKLSEVFQVSHQVSRDEQGRVMVSLGAIEAKTAIRLPGWMQKQASRYRIRFSLIGFNFRKEYYEYLEFRDLEIGRNEKREAQQILFQTAPPKDQLLLLSMTLMAYSGRNMEEGAVLLNSRECSPCALIAAFAAAEVGDLPGRALEPDVAGIPEHRQGRIVLTGYEGNRLIRKLRAKIPQKEQPVTPKGIPRTSINPETPVALTGRRISFRKV